MTELSTHVLDHIIVFHDKSTLQITEKAAKHIDRELMEGKTSHLKIGATTYSKGSISKIMVLADYYEQYPDKRPAPKYKDLTGGPMTHELVEEIFGEKPLGMEGIIRQTNSTKGLEQMRMGFANTGSKEHPIYKSMEAKLTKLKHKQNGTPDLQ